MNEALVFLIYWLFSVRSHCLWKEKEQAKDECFICYTLFLNLDIKHFYVFITFHLLIVSKFDYASKCMSLHLIFFI